MRTLAIGDIHGVSSAFDALMNTVQPTPDDLLVFLGDYVDRGPDTKGVIDRILHLSQTHQLVCLRGNHEVMMYRARHDRGERKMWLSVGGAQAMASYGRGGRATLDDVPEEHWHFIGEACADSFETETHIFVHANLAEGLPLDEQPEQMLFWEHLKGPIDHISEKIVICGHSSQRSGIPKAWPKTVCIDTYAYGGGWLTCLDVGTNRYWQANALGQVREGIIEFSREA